MEQLYQLPGPTSLPQAISHISLASGMATSVASRGGSPARPSRRTSRPAPRSTLKKSQSVAWLSLPSELWNLILRELLVSNGPLMPRLNRPMGAVYATGYVENYHLHPAILGTCRALYQQGRNLLYNENKPCLHLRYSCTRWTLEYSKEVKPIFWISAFEEAPLVVKRYDSNTDSFSLETVKNTKEFILRFRSLRIQVEAMSPGIDYWAMEEILPLLQPIFAGLRLEVTILPDPEQRPLRRHLPFLRIRCKEFTLTGAPQNEVERMVKIVMSDDPVPNVETAYGKLREIIHFVECHGQSTGFKTQLAAIDDHLQAAKVEFDMDKFAVAKKELRILFDLVTEHAKRQIDNNAADLATAFSDDVWKSAPAGSDN